MIFASSKIQTETNWNPVEKVWRLSEARESILSRFSLCEVCESEMVFQNVLRPKIIAQIFNAQDRNYYLYCE